MAQAFQAKRRSEGRSVRHTPTSAVAVGDVVVQGDLVGVAPKAIAANEAGTLEIEGVFDVVKVNGGINAGDALYWDANGNPQGGTAGTGALTTTASGNTFVGWATEDADATDEVVSVLLAKTTGIGGINPLANAIADPGDAGAIPVTQSGRVPLVSAGAETRTLAAPTFAGQQLLLYMKTDNGDITLTCATTINETGNNTITFANTGEAVHLIAVEEGGNLRWRLATADGASLTTV